MKTNPEKNLISVAIVEDDREVRQSLISIINHQPTMECAGAFGSAEEALASLPKLKPQVVLMDINLPGASGIECVRELSVQLPGTQIVMLTVYHNAKAIFDSLASGAIGYLLKPVKAEELISAISLVRAGGAPMSPNIARQVVQTFRRTDAEQKNLPSLTPREKEVLDLLAKGFQSKEIAAKLEMAYWTVETHIGHIYQKLHVRSRAQAVAKYLNR